MGIGTTFSGVKVRIQDNSATGIQLQVVNDNASSRAGITLTSSTNAAFHVQQANNGVAIIENYANASTQFYQKGTVGGFLFHTTDNNNQRMVISNGGNVGIGTETPLAKLHVQGTFFAPNMIIQTVSSQFFPSSHIYNNSATNWYTGLNITVRPRFTNSKLIICFDTSMAYTVGTATVISLRRGATKVTAGSYGWTYITGNVYGPLNLVYEEQAGTTSDINYQLYIDTGNIYIVHQSSYANFTVFEIGQ